MVQKMNKVKLSSPVALQVRFPPFAPDTYRWQLDILSVDVSTTPPHWHTYTHTRLHWREVKVSLQSLLPSQGPYLHCITWDDMATDATMPDAASHLPHARHSFLFQLLSVLSSLAFPFSASVWMWYIFGALNYLAYASRKRLATSKEGLR